MTNIACGLTSQERLQYSGRPYPNLYTRGNDAVIYVRSYLLNVYGLLGKSDQ